MASELGFWTLVSDIVCWPMLRSEVMRRLDHIPDTAGHVRAAEVAAAGVGGQVPSAPVRASGRPGLVAADVPVPRRVPRRVAVPDGQSGAKHCSRRA